MKKRFFVILSLLTVFALVMTGCPQEEETKVSQGKPRPSGPKAELESITIGGVEPSGLGTPVSTWSDVIPVGIYLTSAQLTGATVTATRSEGATAVFAKAAQDVEPAFGTDTVFNFVPGDILWVKVTSSDSEVVNFYAYKMSGPPNSSNYAELTKLTYSTRTGSPVDFPAFDSDKPNESGLPYGNSRVTGLAYINYRMPSAFDNAFKWKEFYFRATASSNATVAYAIANDLDTLISDWSNTSGFFAEVQRGQYVVIRVTSESTTTVKYYKVRPIYGNSTATLTAYTINTVSAATIPPARDSDDYAVYSVFNMPTAPQADNSWASIKVAATASANATATYAKTIVPNDVPDAWNTTGDLGSMKRFETVVICVTSEDTTVNQYYKARLVYGSSNTTLTDIKVGTFSAVSRGTPTDNISSFSGGTAGSVVLTGGDPATIEVSATGPSSATIQFTNGSYNAWFGYTINAANWNTTGAGLFDGFTVTTFFGPTIIPAGVDGAYIFIEVSSGTDIYHYVIVCSAGEPAETDTFLKSLTIGGVEVTNLGTPYSPTAAITSGNFSGTVGAVTLTTTEASDPANILVVATVFGTATVRYGHGPYYGSGPWMVSTAWNTSQSGHFDEYTLPWATGTPVPAGVDGRYIFIEVTASNGTSRSCYGILCSVAD